MGLPLPSDEARHPGSPGRAGRDRRRLRTGRGRDDPQEIYREIRDFFRAHEWRRRQFPRAILVGLLAGLVAVGFRISLAAGDGARNQLITFARTLGPWGILLPALFGAVGAGAAVFLVRRLSPEASGSGIPHLKSVLHHLRGMVWQRVLAVKFVGGVLAIGSGLALGREGPTVQ